MALEIALTASGGTPIYEQIRSQIQDAIVGGALAEGEALPSIRALARDLRVSVITTTRAYNELAAAGLVANVPSKGFYVLPCDGELARERVLREMEEHIEAVGRLAALARLSRPDVHALVDATLDASPQETP